MNIKKKELTDFYNTFFRRGTYKNFETLKVLVTDKTAFLDHDKKEKELQEKLRKFEKMKSRFENTIKAGEESYNTLTKEIKIQEEMMRRLKLQQIKYFSDLLKHGFDVRTEGLVWILKNLIELDAIVTPDMFPSFVDKDCRDFLIKIAQKQVEVMQLEIIKNCLRMNKNKYSTSVDLTNLSKFRKTIYYEATNEVYDAEYVTKIVNCLKNKLKNFYAYNDEEIIKTLSDDPIFSRMRLSDKEKKIYSEINNIKAQISTKNEEIGRLRQDLLFHFKKYESLKTNGLNGLIMYDLIKSALFGNS